MAKQALTCLLVSLLVINAFFILNPPSGYVKASEKQKTSFIQATMDWNHTYGTSNAETLMSMIATQDGGYALIGTSNASGTTDIWLVKTDSAGIMQWNKTFGGSGIDYGYNIIQTNDNGYALVGYTSSYSNSTRAYLIKTGASGNLQWNQTYSESGNCYGEGVIQDTTGCYVVAGYTVSSGNNNMYVFKTDGAGNIQWNQSLGGTGSEMGYSLTETSTGDYAIAGTCPGANSTFTDVWLVVLHNNGQIAWSRTYGGNKAEVPNSIITTSDGGFAIAGYTSSFGATTFYMYAVKTDPIGNLQWNVSYAAKGVAMGYSIIENNVGEFIVSGTTSPTILLGTQTDAFLARIDMFGNVIVSSTYGGSGNDLARKVIQTSDGSYVFGGATTSYGAGNYDFWLVKTPDVDPAMTVVAADGSGDYTSLSLAINNTVAGGTIYVKSGSYDITGIGNLLASKSLTIIGEDKATTTITSNGLQIGRNLSYITFENVNLTINGNFGVLGSTIVNIRDSDFVLNQTSGYEYEIQTYDYAALTFFNVNVLSDYGFSETFSIYSLYAFNSGIANFYKTNWNQYIDTCSNGKLNVISSTNLGYFTVNQATFNNCTGNGYISNSGNIETVPLTIINSNLSSVALTIYQRNLNVTGVNAGYISYFNSLTNLTQADSSLNIINSTISLEFDVINSTINFKDCSDLTLTASSASIIKVDDSSLNALSTDWWYFWPASNSISLHNTTVAGAVSIYSDSNLTASNSTFAYVYSEGNAAISLQNVSVISALATYSNSKLSINKSTVREIDAFGNTVIALAESNISASLYLNGNTSCNSINSTANYIYTYNYVILSMQNSAVSSSYINENATLDAFNSSFFEIDASSNASLNLQNTKVTDYFLCYQLTKNPNLSNVTIGYLLVEDSTLYLSNSLTITSVDLNNSTITRNYQLAVKDSNGNFVSQASLNLYSSQNDLLWTGQTDSVGLSNFNLTVSEDNFTNVCTLKAGSGASFALQQITLASSTPILLSIQLHNAAIHDLNTGLSYYTIQDAIKAPQTQNGDTIFVDQGTYRENLVISKSLKLMGENSSLTIIDGGSFGNAISIASNNVTISGFTIESSNNYYSEICGVVVDTCSGANITGNIFKDGYAAIEANNCSYINVKHNDFQSNMIGLIEYYSSDSFVDSNSFTNNTVGFAALNSTATVSNNNMMGNLTSQEGIILALSSNCTIDGNTITQYSAGVYLMESGSNLLYQNYVTNNTLGIYSQESSANLIYHNFFFNNTIQAMNSANSTNIWDNGYPSGGNYWSDYNGTDSNHDGIGDTPYTIDGNNTDQYPLVYSTGSYDAGQINGTERNINTLSNSTISNFEMNQTDRTVSFNVTGASGTSGFTILTIPTTVMQNVYHNIFTVYIDGQPTDCRTWSDGTNTYIYVNYTHSTHTLEIVGDTTPPVTTNNYNGQWHTSDVTITLSASDSNGISDIFYKINGGATKTVSVNGQPVITTEGSNSFLEYWSVDGADNEESHHTLSNIKIDKTTPSTTNNYDGQWHTSNFQITLTANDATSGVSQINYKINNGATKSVGVDGQPQISTEGISNSLEYWSVDAAGNAESHHTLSTIELDKTAPTGTIQVNNGAGSTSSVSVTLTLTAQDTTSGVDKVRFSNSGSWDNAAWETFAASKTWTLTDGDGTKIVYYQIRDNSGLTQVYNATISLQTQTSSSPTPSSSTSSSSSSSSSSTPKSTVKPSSSASASPTPSVPEISFVTIVSLLALVTVALVGIVQIQKTLNRKYTKTTQPGS